MFRISVENLVLNFLSVWEKIKFLSWYVFLAAPCIYPSFTKKHILAHVSMMRHTWKTWPSLLQTVMTVMTISQTVIASSRINFRKFVFKLYKASRGFSATGELLFNQQKTLLPMMVNAQLNDIGSASMTSKYGNIKYQIPEMEF